MTDQPLPLKPYSHKPGFACVGADVKIQELEAENKQLIEGIGVIKAEIKLLRTTMAGLSGHIQAQEDFIKQLTEGIYATKIIQEQAETVKILTEALERIVRLNNGMSFAIEFELICRQALDRVRGK